MTPYFWNVETLAHSPVVEESREEGRFLLWGYAASPEQMTRSGRNLFLNAVDWMLSKQASAVD